MCLPNFFNFHAKRHKNADSTNGSKLERRNVRSNLSSIFVYYLFLKPRKYTMDLNVVVIAICTC